jgi:septal ring factor EnvC (AmiA/AmiB activator)
VSSTARTLLRAVAVALVLVAACLGLGGHPAAGQQATGTGASDADRARSLQAQIAAETRRIAATRRGLEAAQARLSRIEAELAAHEAEQRRVGARIVAARERIEYLENRMRRSMRMLERNLVDAYENPPPDVVSVVLRARSFGDLLRDAEFRRRVAEQNAQVMDDARRDRAEVVRETRRLVALQERLRRIADRIEARRNEARAVTEALIRVQRRQLARRAAAASRLREIRARIAALEERRRREAERDAAARRRAAAEGITLASGGVAQAPPGAPEAVRRVIAAGNAIAGLPYIYGGGHGSFKAAGYDCSGSISYALAAAGLLSAPLDSTGFMSWGEPGPGRWITVYANAGHAYMVVAGWRFDTSALRGGGTRWTRTPRSPAGFVARHPPGL